MLKGKFLSLIRTYLMLGLAGLLLLALFLGKVGRTGSLVWTKPLSANLVLRNFGLTIFLAQVGIASGPKFFAAVGATGVTFLLYGAIIALALVLITTLICLWLFRLPFDTALGGSAAPPATRPFLPLPAAPHRPIGRMSAMR